jgi:hypothetical protein
MEATCKIYMEKNPKPGKLEIPGTEVFDKSLS